MKTTTKPEWTRALKVLKTYATCAVCGGSLWIGQAVMVGRVSKGTRTVRVVRHAPSCSSPTWSGRAV